jgi:hypothetical protein
MSCFRMCLLLAMWFGVLGTLPAQVSYPPPAEKSDVHFRYRIRADRDERIRQFREMTSYLKKQGFELTPREDSDLDIFDPTAELMNGTIPTANAKKLLDEGHIQTAIVLPAGMTLPDDGKKLLEVRLLLRSGFAAKEQREFHSQVALHLELLGFRQSASYDHQSYSLLRGSVPAESLFRLLKDLRTQPTGWFGPLISPDLLPLPLRVVSPVRFVEVLPELPTEMIAPPPAPTAPSTSPAIVKLSSDVRQIVEDATASLNPVRVDVILQDYPGNNWRDSRIRLRTAVSTGSIEGLLGLVATVRVGVAAEVIKIAELPEVRSIRLPRSANETGLLLAPKNSPLPNQYIAESRLSNLHQAGYRGESVRVVVLASGFPGAAALIGKSLPKSTTILDITGEVHPDLIASPEKAERPGTGTATALAVHAAAPDAQLILVRIDPTAFHQLGTVTRAILGEVGFSIALQTRSEEFISRAEVLDNRRRQASEEYRKAFSDLSDEEAQTKRREAAAATLEKVLNDERQFKSVVERFATLKTGLEQLKGVGVVVNTLTWDTGYPQDGLSEISRLLEDRFTPKPVESALRLNKQPAVPLWVQPASIGLGQVWAGPFLDSDNNGIMEFAPETVKIPAKRWTRELNFLGFAPNDGQPTLGVLPAGAKIRVTAAWREPHDPDGFLLNEPVFPLNLRLFKQVDPEAKQRSSDDLLEVGFSSGIPARLVKTAGSGAFEQTLEVTIPSDGVYALRLEGSFRVDYDIPALKQKVEIYPRVVIEAADNATAAKGRPIFQSYVQNRAGVGMPGDATSVITVGTLENANLTGTGPGIVLRIKPELLVNSVYANGGVNGSGTAISAGYAGGAAASLLSAGVRASDLVRTVGLKPGQALVIPEDLLQRLPGKR